MIGPPPKPPRRRVVLAERRMTWSRELELMKVLQDELNAFKVKITPAANETFEAGREREHDDLVLSLSLAAWVGENLPRPMSDQRVRDLVLSAPPGLDNKQLAAGEGARSRMEAIAADHPYLFTD